MDLQKHDPIEGQLSETRQHKEVEMKGKVFISFVAILVMTVVVNTYAADYPTRPITLMVPTGAGGPTDTGARILAAFAEKKIGQPIVVVNKPGAGQQIGNTELSRAKPDGYFIGCLGLPQFNTMILDPDRKTTFDVDSFTPIINQVTDPGLIWVAANSPYKTLKDVIDDAKKRPGVIRASTTAILGDDHLAIMMLQKAAGIKFRIVHFNTSPEQITATLGGNVDVSFDNVGADATLEKAGKVRGLAVMDGSRSSFLPHVPTTVELGLPSVISNSSRGIMGPKGMPEPIVKKLQAVLLETMKDPEYIEKMNKVSLIMKPIVGEEYVKFVKDTHAICIPLVEEYRKNK
jgi:tripartite-type tricarboxylate transporter receptor subunit TctC